MPDVPTSWPWFPSVDPLGPANAEAVSHENVAKVLDLAIETLAPTAAASDIDGVPRHHLDALAAAGVLGPSFEPAVQREIAEILSGACGSTWFCWTQHRTPTDWITASPNELVRGRWADGVASGKYLAGVAFAHIRRPGPPGVTATRRDGGWRVSGHLNWVTSWTIADVIAIAAETDDGQLVRFVTEPKRREGLLADLPLELSAMGGTHTCPVQLDNLFVRDADVIDVVSKAEWAHRDEIGTANAAPHLFGVTRAALGLLLATAEQRHDEAARDLALALVERTRSVRRNAYELADLPEDHLEDRLHLRAVALDLATTATTAAVAARSGEAVRLSDPAQRLAREAMFYLVQAQTASLRAQTLAQWQRRVGEN